MNAPDTRDGPRTVAGDVRRAWCASLMILAALLALPGLARAESDPTPGADWPPELSDPAPTAQGLVDAGRSYLDRGQLGPAVEVLGLAAALSPDDAEAHWLLAQALTTIRLDHPGSICTWGAWPDVIGDHVVAAVEADPARLAVLLDADGAARLREVLANSIALRVLREPGLVGRPEAHGAVMVDGRPVVTVRRGVRGKHARRELLVQTRWYGLDERGASDSTELDLRADGTAVWATVHRDADHTKSARYARGRWVERRGFVQLQRDGEAENVWLTLDGLIAKEGPVRYSDRPVDCTRPFDVWAGFQG